MATKKVKPRLCAHDGCGLRVVEGCNNCVACRGWALFGETMLCDGCDSAAKRKRSAPAGQPAPTSPAKEK